MNFLFFNKSKKLNFFICLPLRKTEYVKTIRLSDFFPYHYHYTRADEIISEIESKGFDIPVNLTVLSFENKW